MGAGSAMGGQNMGQGGMGGMQGQGPQAGKPPMMLGGNLPGGQQAPMAASQSQAMASPMGAPQQPQGLGALQSAYSQFMNAQPQQPSPMFGQQPMGQSNPMQSTYQAYGQALQAQQPMGQQMPMTASQMAGGMSQQGNLQQQMQMLAGQPQQSQMNPMQSQMGGNLTGNPQSAAYDQFLQAQKMAGGMSPSNPMQQMGGMPQQQSFTPQQQEESYRQQAAQAAQSQDPMLRGAGNAYLGGGQQAMQDYGRQMMQQQQQPMRAPMMPQAPTAQQVRPEDQRMQAMRNMQRTRGYNR